MAARLSASEPSDARLLLLAPDDNVLVARADIAAGETILVDGVPVLAARAIPRGHKLARHAIVAGAKILKYGAPIGSATATIARGEHVHVSNLKSDYTATHLIDRAG